MFAKGLSGALNCDDSWHVFRHCLTVTVSFIKPPSDLRGAPLGWSGLLRRCGRPLLPALVVLAGLVPVHSAQGETAKPQFLWYGPDQPRSGTVVVQDKMRGLLWLLDLQRRRSVEVVLPFNGGNHESVLSADGRWLVTGHYETIPAGGAALAGIPGDEVSLVDLQTASVKVYPTVASPRPASKSHGLLWLQDGRLAVTAELANAVVIYPPPGQAGSAQVVDLGSTGCRTPHLLRQVFPSSLVVVTCRATNPGDPPTTPGFLVAIDLKSGAVRAMPSGSGAEGMVVTPNHEVWVGNLREDTVSIFGFKGGRLTLDALVLKARLNVPKPMRLAYEPMTNTVGIISNGAAAQAINFRSYDAGTHQLQHAVVLESRERGQIDPQGLAAITGQFITGGINNQALLMVDAKTMALQGEVLLPRCPLTSQTNDGSCLPTMRNPNNATPAMLDGFAWTPVTPGP